MELRYPIQNPRVRDALLTVPRETFVPEFAKSKGLDAVYRNEVIATMKTDSGSLLSSSSMPGIMAEMLDRLNLEEGHRVLEIGAGTGYNAALLKDVVGPGGVVVAVDIEPQMADWARSSLAEAGYPVEVITGDGRDGYADGAPYDRIIVTASAWDIPRAWAEQLTQGGLLVLPLRLDEDLEAQMGFTLRREEMYLASTSSFRAGFLSIREHPGLAQDPGEHDQSLGHRVEVLPDLPAFKDRAEAYDFRAFVALYSAEARSTDSQVVPEWLSLGRPGADRMLLRVYYSDAPSSWRVLSRGESILCFDWAPDSRGK